jgi:glycosyltransferase involved in cell wall biosynthesis
MERSATAGKVCHLTSAHVVEDTRILHKQCATLAAQGYAVVLIAPSDGDRVIRGVRVKAVPRARSRLGRMTRTSFRIYRAALAEDGDLYHFHDPELIPVGLLLRLHGKRVVYDVHEDYRTSIGQKIYLPRWLRGPLASGVAALERLASRTFEVVLAERYYTERFPSGTLVLNYPVVTEIAEPLARGTENRIRFVYTGGVTEDRGALYHASLVQLREDIEVHVVGRCSPELAERMRAAAGPGRDRLHIVGEGFHVPYERIIDTYREGGWTAGLAMFPSTAHYRRKELTKFFEYMAAGIPVLCSDFPVWRALVEGNGCGMCADPADGVALRKAVEDLIGNPERSKTMGRRGREAVSARYNWANEAASLIRLYERLIGVPASAARAGGLGDEAEAFRERLA